jgi:hypothetical protein
MGMGDMNKKRLRCFPFFLIWGLLMVTAPQLCRADDIYTIIVKKQETKEKNRWSLSDWLETRDRMRLQDLWLALHSPSPYEFYVGGNYQSNQISNANSTMVWEAFAAAYASIFGLEARYESNFEKRTFGIFDLRIFGFHDQATNITLQGGVRSSDTGTYSYRNALVGVSVTLYLARHFGVDGLYRYYLPAAPNPSEVSISGYRYQGGAFLDFQFLRIYGNYLNDVETTVSWSGFTLGTKIYF